MRDAKEGVRVATVICEWCPRFLSLMILLSLFPVATVLGEDALRPRTHGDWDYDNAPLPAYRNCHPALTECQLPVRPITKDESSLNERAVPGERLGTPAPSIVPNNDETVGPEIGKDDSFNKKLHSKQPTIIC
ncbi:MAG: hypothetical protein ABL970_08380 [Nitrospira sp.]